MRQARKLERVSSAVMAAQELVKRCLDVQSATLDLYIETAINAGAWFAKAASDARSIGGSVFAVTKPELAQIVAGSLKHAGAHVHIDESGDDGLVHAHRKSIDGTCVRD
jgi:hypothetical protein